MDATHRIKNLSIALEALSRINTIRSRELLIDTEELLSQEIFMQRKETKEKLYPTRPATPTIRDAINKAHDKDEQIPF